MSPACKSRGKGERYLGVNTWQRVQLLGVLRTRNYMHKYFLMSNAMNAI